MPNLPKNARINPTDKTLQWEIMLGKALIKFAHRKGYRGNKPLPTFTFVPKSKRIRPAFGGSDLGILVEALPRYVAASTNDRQRASRTLLSNYVLTLAMSGMRVGELNSLRMRDLVSFRDNNERVNLQFTVRGKTGKRIVIPRIDANIIIETMLLYRKGTPDRDARLFVMPNGNGIITLADQFRAFLRFAKIDKNGDDETFTLYSLRHTYATRAIQDGIEIYTIALNMGTSVSIIEQYYGKHATSVQRATTLGGHREDYEISRRDGVVVANRVSQPSGKG
jgi:integrase